MMLIVFVKRQHKDYVKNVCTDSVGTGILGKLVNSCICFFDTIILNIILGK